VLAGTDPIGAAKVLTDFAKEFEKPAIKAGLVDGKAITQAQVKHLASLPSKLQLLAQLGGALQAPMAGFLGVLNGLLYGMVGALEALRDNAPRALPLHKARENTMATQTMSKDDILEAIGNMWCSSWRS